MNNNLKVVIDAGHGGDDPGAVANGLREKDFTLAISQYMLERFRTLGIPATLIRATDETVSPTERVERVLAAYGNNPNIVVISNHINSASNTTAEGAEVIYALRNDSTLARNILNELGNAGQVTRSYYQRRLPSDPTKDYYFILRNTGNTQPVLIEYGFITNPEDIARVQANYRSYADAVVNAVVKTFLGGTSGNAYKVVSGDTLYSISQRFNTTVDELKALNNLSSNILSIGQILEIPIGMVVPGIGNRYVVKKGDSLYSIAQRYNTTVDDIKRLNNLTSNILQIGQTLQIPSSEISEGNLYTVKRGDTLWSIAQQFRISVDELRTLNNLTSNLISIGQVLRIPNTTNSGTGNRYVVKKGDTLYSIAQRYNTTVSNIRNLNNLTSDVLSIGQILFI